MEAALEKVTDYGNGSFKGMPLVLVTMNPSDVYHRHDHGGRLHNTTTFTEPFMADDWHLRPCRVCWPSAPTEDPTP